MNNLFLGFIIVSIFISGCISGNDDKTYEDVKAVQESIEKITAKLEYNYIIIYASNAGGANTDLTIKNIGKKPADMLKDVTIKVDGAITGTFSGCASSLAPRETCTATLTGVIFPNVGESKSIELILADGSFISYGCYVTTADVC